MTCARCLEEKPLPYRVRSEILDIMVCAQCGIEAYELSQSQGEAGPIRVAIVRDENKG